MTLDDSQIKIVLAAAMSYDNRKLPGVANRAAWVEAARRANWTLDAAVEAVHQHYAVHTDFLMPGHITQLIRAERRQPAPFAPLPPPPAIESTVRALASALPSIDDDDKPARPGITRAFSRWNTRRVRRTPLAEVRASIEAELDAKRPAPEEPS